MASLAEGSASCSTESESDSCSMPFDYRASLPELETSLDQYYTTQLEPASFPSQNFVVTEKQKVVSEGQHSDATPSILDSVVPDIGKGRVSSRRRISTAEFCISESSAIAGRTVLVTLDDLKKDVDDATAVLLHDTLHTVIAFVKQHLEPVLEHQASVKHSSAEDAQTVKQSPNCGPLLDDSVSLEGDSVQQLCLSNSVKAVLMDAGRLPETFTDILRDIARNGVVRLPWNIIRFILLCKSEQILSELLPTNLCASESLIDSLRPLRMTFSHLWSLSLAPFTLQRASEFLLTVKSAPSQRAVLKYSYSLARALSAATIPLVHQIPAALVTVQQCLMADLPFMEALTAVVRRMDKRYPISFDNPGRSSTLFAALSTNSTLYHSVSSALRGASDEESLSGGGRSSIEEATTPLCHTEPLSRHQADPVRHRRRRSRNSFEVFTPRRGCSSDHPTEPYNDLINETWKAQDLRKQESFSHSSAYTTRASDEEFGDKPLEMPEDAGISRAEAPVLLASDSLSFVAPQQQSLSSVFLRELTEKDDEEEEASRIGAFNGDTATSVVRPCKRVKYDTESFPPSSDNSWTVQSHVSLMPAGSNAPSNDYAAPSEGSDSTTSETPEDHVFAEILALSVSPSANFLPDATLETHKAGRALLVSSLDSASSNSSDIYSQTSNSPVTTQQDILRQHLCSPPSLSETLLPKDYFDEDQADDEPNQNNATQQVRSSVEEIGCKTPEFSATTSAVRHENKETTLAEASSQARSSDTCAEAAELLSQSLKSVAHY